MVTSELKAAVMFQNLLAILLLASPIWSQTCDPTTCLLPSCRCPGDPNPPGNLPLDEVPQIIMVTFEGTVNSDTVDDYLKFFEIANPNGCSARGSFFVQDNGTDFGLVRALSLSGHEIGVTAADGNVPADSTAWIQSIKQVQGKLSDIGVDLKSVMGVRAPGFQFDGTAELIGIGDNKMLYDTSCTSVGRSNKDGYLWPYTLDFVPSPDCDNGAPLDKVFPGKWQVPVDDLHDLDGINLPCVAPSACRNITTKQNAFDLFFKEYEKHYTGKKTPFMMVVDPAWAKNQDLRDGTIEFLQYVRAAFGDAVWIVPVQKALDWIMDPTPIANLTSFQPWGCN